MFFAEFCLVKYTETRTSLEQSHLTFDVVIAFLPPVVAIWNVCCLLSFHLRIVNARLQCSTIERLLKLSGITAIDA